jgi:hypothetical protein
MRVLAGITKGNKKAVPNGIAAGTAKRQQEKVRFTAD